jgi:hypothetical protein
LNFGTTNGLVQPLLVQTVKNNLRWADEDGGTWPTREAGPALAVTLSWWYIEEMFLSRSRNWARPEIWDPEVPSGRKETIFRILIRPTGDGSNSTRYFDKRRT